MVCREAFFTFSHCPCSTAMLVAASMFASLTARGRTLQENLGTGQQQLIREVVANELKGTANRPQHVAIHANPSPRRHDRTTRICRDLKGGNSSPLGPERPAPHQK
jgi:hypothetical protein